MWSILQLWEETEADNRRLMQEMARVRGELRETKYVMEKARSKVSHISSQAHLGGSYSVTGLITQCAQWYREEGEKGGQGQIEWDGGRVEGKFLDYRHNKFISSIKILVARTIRRHDRPGKIFIKLQRIMLPFQIPHIQSYTYLFNKVYTSPCPRLETDKLKQLSA